MQLQQPPVIAPSILAADFTQLGDQVQDCVEAGTNWIHCDIMDGHFVPNISYGPVIVEAAGRNHDVFLDVHCMIEEPGRFIQSIVEAGADLITVHQEVCPHLHRTVQQIKQQGLNAGVAVNPATSLHQIVPILPWVNLVLVMSVNPGFGGQSFIESSLQKVERLRHLREQTDTQFLIEVDGGINTGNIHNISVAGGDVFVAGSSIFESSGIKEQIHILRDEASKDKNLYV